MSGLLSTVFSVILKSVVGMIDKWVTGKQLVEAQTEAKSREAAMASVGEGRAVEEATRVVADPNDPPVNPRVGQKWVNPKGVLLVWDGKSFILEEDYAKDDSDFFGDSAWNSSS